MEAGPEGGSDPAALYVVPVEQHLLRVRRPQRPGAGALVVQRGKGVVFDAEDPDTRPLKAYLDRNAAAVG